MSYLQAFQKQHPSPILTHHNLPAIKQWLTHLNHFIDTIICQTADFKASFALRNTIIEQILIHLMYSLTFNPNQFSLLALGGFGRGELLPHSDIDMLLLLDHIDFKTQQKLEQLATILWDIGITPALSVKTLNDDDCAKHLTTATSFLESRLIIGNQQWGNLPYSWLKSHWQGNHFFDQKIAERQMDYHRQQHQAPPFNTNFIEPNIKTDFGTLREIHLLLWLSKFYLNLPPTAHLAKLHHIGLLNQQEYWTLNQALKFFWLIRHHLHTVSKQNNNQLSLNIQPIIAHRLKTTTNQLIKDHQKYSNHVFSLFLILISRLKSFITNT